MRLVQQARALAGRGLEGDRYADGAGTFSSRGAQRPGFDLTLIAAEVVGELTARDAALDLASTRRNVLTRGIEVNALVGRGFTVGDVRCRGLRLAEPCAHLERLAGPGLLRPLIHRGGVRVDLLSGGSITTGSAISTSRRGTPTSGRPATAGRRGRWHARRRPGQPRGAEPDCRS